MSCVHLLKSAAPSSDSQVAKFGCFFPSEFKNSISKKRNIRLLRNSSGIGYNRRFGVSCKLEENNNKGSKGDEPPESLFMKELRRRGMTPTSLLEEKNRTVDKDEEVKFREEDGGWSYSTRNSVSTDADINLSNQRETSMALNSEGLEGLIPRAKLLLTLGGTFFLAFWPLILATVASFLAVYLYFGPQFLHDGTTSRIAPPPYVDPYALLEEQKMYKIAPLLK